MAARSTANPQPIRGETIRTLDIVAEDDFPGLAKGDRIRAAFRSEDLVAEVARMAKLDPQKYGSDWHLRVGDGIVGKILTRDECVEALEFFRGKEMKVVLTTVPF